MKRITAKIQPVSFIDPKSIKYVYKLITYENNMNCKYFIFADVYFNTIVHVFLL